MCSRQHIIHTRALRAAGPAPAHASAAGSSLAVLMREQRSVKTNPVPTSKLDTTLAMSRTAFCLAFVVLALALPAANAQCIFGGSSCASCIGTRSVGPPPPSRAHAIVHCVHIAHALISNRVSRPVAHTESRPRAHSALGAPQASISLKELAWIHPVCAPAALDRQAFASE